MNTMRLHKVGATNTYEGNYGGYHVEIWHVRHADWVVFIDSESPEHFDSLAHARRETMHVIDWHVAQRQTSTS
jgi:hypothetical protein